MAGDREHEGGFQKAAYVLDLVNGCTSASGL